MVTVEPGPRSDPSVVVEQYPLKPLDVILAQFPQLRYLVFWSTLELGGIVFVLPFYELLLVLDLHRCLCFISGDIDDLGIVVALRDAK